MTGGAGVLHELELGPYTLTGVPALPALSVQTTAFHEVIAIL